MTNIEPINAASFNRDPVDENKHKRKRVVLTEFTYCSMNVSEISLVKSLSHVSHVEQKESIYFNKRETNCSNVFIWLLFSY